MDIQFIFTPLLKSSVDRIVMNIHKLNNIDKETRDLIEKYSNTTTEKTKSIPYSFIKKASEYLKEIYLNEEINNKNTTENNSNNKDINVNKEEVEEEVRSSKEADCTPPCYLQDLLKGSTIYIEPKPIVVEDPEKIAKRQYLQGLYNEQQYKRLVKNVAGEKEDAMELGSISSQASIGMNILATFFTLMACGLFLGGKMWDNYVLGLALGLGFGIVGVGVEVWLFVIKSSEVQFEKEKIRKEEERIGNIKVKRRIREIKKGINVIDQDTNSTLMTINDQ